MGSTLSSNVVLTVYQAPTVLFFDDFNGPNLNPIWQTNLPNAFDGEFPAYPEPAPYIGAPTCSFGLLDSNTVLNMNSVIGPEQRVGWSSSIDFQANNFRYEARFNTEFLSPTTSVDGFFEIWIMNATNDNLYDLVSPFAQGGTFLFMFFSSSVDDNYFNRSPYAFANNTWYRLVLQGLPGQNIRASLCDDNDNELSGYTFNHNASAFGSGFKIVIAQSMGDDVTQPCPSTVAVDYVRLTTGFAPTITAQPQSQIAIVGMDVALTVTVVGTSPLGYQWNFNGAAISGATNSTLTFTDVQLTNSGNYSVVVTNIYGISISSNATLIVGLPPTITGQPMNETLGQGATAVFSVTANGTAPLSYQWNVNGANIVGATNATLTLTNVLFSESGNYSVLITNIFGSASSTALLTVLAPPAIISGPKNLTVAAGGTVTFAVTATGTLPLNYLWSFNGANIPGATNSTLTLTNVALSQAGSYSVFIINAYGSTNSAYATITVNVGGSFRFFDDFNGPVLNPIWQTNLPNAYNGSSEIATNIGAPNYSFGLLDSNTVLNMDSVIGPLQRVGWSSSTNFQVGNFRYEARFNTLFISSTTSVDGFFEIWIMNATNDNLYDIVSPFAGSLGADLYMFFGSSVDTNYMQISYAFADNAWYRLVLQCLPGQNIRASLCDDNERELIGYTFNHDASAFGSGLKIIIAQTAGTYPVPRPTSVAVDYASLGSQFLPAIIDQPQSKVVPERVNATLSVVALGAPPLSYQWNLGGADIAGATNATLTLANVQLADQGSYSVLATNPYGSILSSNAILTVTVGLPSLAIVSSSGTLHISWPTNSSGFVLVTTTNLVSGNWAPVTTSPLQNGNQYVMPVIPTGTEAFYRLQYTAN